MPDLENSNDGPVKEDISSTLDSDVGESMVGSARGSSSTLRSDSYTKGNVGESRRGKSGSVSFCGLTHQILEERKLVSSPFKDGTGTILWVLGPLALISSLFFPQFFLSTFIESVLGDEILAGIYCSWPVHNMDDLIIENVSLL